MGGRQPDRVVVRPLELRVVATRFGRAAEEFGGRARSLESESAGVRLNSGDPGLVVAAFAVRRHGVTEALRRAERAWSADRELMDRTAEQALVADGDPVATAAAVDVLSQRVRGSVGVPVDRLERLVVRRSALIRRLADGSEAAAGVLGAYMAGGGPMSELFDSALSDSVLCRPGVGGGVIGSATTVGARIERLTAQGRWAEAKVVDDALAVALLIASERTVGRGGQVGGAGGIGWGAGRRAGADGPFADTMLFGNQLFGPGRLDLFDLMVARGTDIGVAANTARVGARLPSGDELHNLVDHLVAVFSDGGGSSSGFTIEQWGWLPFRMRMALASGSPWSGGRRGGAGGGVEIRPSDGAAAGPFLGGPDAVSTELMVVGELGRAGLDGSGGAVLAGRLVDRVSTLGSGESADVHDLVARVVGDEATGLDAAFVSLLGLDGLAALTRSVMTSMPAGSTRRWGDDGFGDRDRLDIVGAYGDALAHVERRGALPFTAAELVAAGAGADHPAIFLLGGGEPFSAEFALEAAELVVDLPGEAFRPGGHDPRGFVVHQVALNGPAAGLELINRLGDDFLDTLVWNPSPIESTLPVHPVYRLFEPILDGHLVDGLDVTLIGRAGSDPTGGASVPRHSGAVVERAMVGDIELLAPMAVAAHGDDAVVEPGIVLRATEAVFRSGAGDQLLAVKGLVIPTLTAGARIEGLDSISRRTYHTLGEAVTVIDLGREEALLAEAASADEVNSRIKFWGPAVVTALAGGVFDGPTQALIVSGFATNVGVDAGSEALLSTDHRLDVYEQLRLGQHDWSGGFQEQILLTLQHHNAVDITGIPDNFVTIHDEPVAFDGGATAPFGHVSREIGQVVQRHQFYGGEYRKLVDGAGDRKR